MNQSTIECILKITDRFDIKKTNIVTQRFLYIEIRFEIKTFPLNWVMILWSFEKVQWVQMVQKDKHIKKIYL